MSWITDNWGTIIGIFLATIVAGIIGWFSAIMSLKTDINDFKTQVTKQITELKNDVDKVSSKLILLESHADKLNALEKSILVLKTRTDTLTGRTDEIYQQTIYFYQAQWQRGTNPRK